MKIGKSENRTPSIVYYFPASLIWLSDEMQISLGCVGGSDGSRGARCQFHKVAALCGGLLTLLGILFIIHRLYATYCRFSEMLQASPIDWCTTAIVIATDTLTVAFGHVGHDEVGNHGIPPLLANFEANGQRIRVFLQPLLKVVKTAKDGLRRFRSFLRAFHQRDSG